MQAYDWMVKYTPQTEWIARRGILLWLAFFFIELGAGMFFMGSLFQSRSGMLAGWLICGILGGGLHLLFLGKPLRFWRIVFSGGFKTSWISRGLIFVALFLLLGLISILIGLQSDPPTALLVLVDIFAFLTVIYGGFAMNFVNGIPLWNTALLPVLYVISGLWGGAEMTLGIALGGGDFAAGLSIENWTRIFLIGFILMIPVYLISVRYTTLTGQASVRSVVKGKMAPLFWPAVVFLGMLVPAAAVIASFALGLEQTPAAFLYIAIICGLAGDLSLRYLILKCGMYSPLIPSSSGEAGLN
jgi:sulfite dehydrogenase (quinone) subunit SoeC